MLHHKGRICLHDHGTIGGIKTILVFLSAGSRLETNQYFIHPHTLQQLLRAPEPWIFGSSFWTSLFSRLTCGTHSVYSKINFSPFLLRLFVHSISPSAKKRPVQSMSYAGLCSELKARHHHGMGPGGASGQALLAVRSGREHGSAFPWSQHYQ